MPPIHFVWICRHYSIAEIGHWLSPMSVVTFFLPVCKRHYGKPILYVICARYSYLRTILSPALNLQRVHIYIYCIQNSKESTNIKQLNVFIIYTVYTYIQVYIWTITLSSRIWNYFSGSAKKCIKITNTYLHYNQNTWCWNIFNRKVFKIVFYESVGGGQMTRMGITIIKIEGNCGHGQGYIPVIGGEGLFRLMPPPPPDISFRFNTACAST